MTATQTVQAPINYWLDPKLGGFEQYVINTVAYHFDRKFSPATVSVHDIRGHESDYTFENQGFELLHGCRPIKEDGANAEEIKAKAYPEIEELVKRAVGATKVVIFSHLHRSVGVEETKAEAENLPRDQILKESPPANFAHIDQGPESAVVVLKGTLPEEESRKWLNSRWAIINAWRPLKPVHRDPLAVCDCRTVLDEDLKEVRATPPNSTFANSKLSGNRPAKGFQVMLLKENPDHKWYYASAMQPDEALLLTIHDTKKTAGNTARRCPHSAIPVRDSDDVRESIEFRTLVLWEDQPAT